MNGMRVTSIFLILTLIVGLTGITACKKEDEPTPEPSRISIAVNDTDSGYDNSENPHVVFYNQDLQLDKLLLFIGGSFSNPKNYETICEHARQQGFHVISLSYPNNIAAASLGDAENENAFDNYREEICYGAAVSDDVEVYNLNSIVTRTTKLLAYLTTYFENQNWDQFLTDGTPNWNKIVVSGHSQGAGHACYLGKKELVNRVVMFSGPNDYSDFFSAPAGWLSEPGVTHNNKQFVLLHGEDNVVPYEKQLEHIIDTGII